MMTLGLQTMSSNNAPEQQARFEEGKRRSAMVGLRASYGVTLVYRMRGLGC